MDLNGPGRYLHWNIFTVSLANLVLIADDGPVPALASSELTLVMPTGQCGARWSSK